MRVRRSIYRTVWFTTFLLAELLASRAPVWGDAAEACRTADNLLTYGRPYRVADDGTQDAASLTPEGQSSMRFSPIFVLECMPMQALKPLIRAISGIGGSGLGQLSVTIVPAAIAATGAVVSVALFEFLGAPLAWAVCLALTAWLCSPLLHYSRTYNSDAMQTVLLTAFGLAWLRDEERPTRLRSLLASTLLGLLIACKAVFAVLIPVLLVRVAVRPDRLREFLRMARLQLPVLCLFGGLVLSYNFFRFGAWFSTGYEHFRNAMTLRFEQPLLYGLFGLFLSPGKSLFLYAPFLLFPCGAWLSKRRTSAELFLGGLALSTIIVHAKSLLWNGDWAWGPRYLVPCTVLLMAPLARVEFGTKAIRRTFGATCAVAVAVNALGVLFHPAWYMSFMWQRSAPIFAGADINGVADDIFPLHFVPEFSPVSAHWWYLEAMLFGPEAALADYPWKHLGLPGYVPTEADLPKNVDLWFSGSLLHTLVAAVLVLALGALSLRLARLLATASGTRRQGAASPF